jgi:hypothetical protein
MVQALMLALVSMGKRPEREREADDGETDEVELPEDSVNWRAIRWVETKARRRGGRAGNRRLADVPPPKVLAVHEGCEFSWKNQTRARRQFARHLRLSWGRTERREAA